jgi:putative two-component system response regulator
VSLSLDRSREQLREPVEPAFGEARILVVDDLQTNVRLLEEVLESAGYPNVIGTTDSSEVLELCDETEPDLLLLDLQMPPPDGFELLERLRPRTSVAARLPVLVLTADITPEAKRRALSLGARDFLTKPFDFTEVLLRVRNLLETRGLELDLRSQNLVLEKRVRARTRELEQARLETLKRLALAADYRDNSAEGHSERVGRAAALIGGKLGLPDEEVALIRHAAPLHDIGKIALSDSILLKPGQELTPDELELMKTHTLVGSQILSGSGVPVLDLSAEIALAHHERWDGSGYPAGLAGEEIPLSARLTAIADLFEVAANRRARARDPAAVEAAVAEVSELSSSWFDPRAILAFQRLDLAALPAP